MSGILLRWLGGGGGDTLCQLLVNNNSETYMNFVPGVPDKSTGRTIIDNDHDADYPLVSRLGHAKPISDKEKLKEEFVKLIKEHKKFIVKFHNFDQEFDRMLIEDANDKSKWKLKSVIGYKPNRLLSYPCNYFHSKYPNKFENPRKVLVIFYK